MSFFASKSDPRPHTKDPDHQHAVAHHIGDHLGCGLLDLHFANGSWEEKTTALPILASNIAQKRAERLEPSRVAKQCQRYEQSAHTEGAEC